jgi:hypothetical protein
MDSNAHDPLWNSAYTDQKGTELLDIILNKEFSIANTLLEDLSVIPQNTTFVDVTLAGNNIGDKISNWHYLDLPSLSDHPFIGFDLALQPRKTSRIQKRLPKLDSIDVRLFVTLLSSLLPVKTPLLSLQDVDVAIEGLTIAIQNAATNKAVKLPCPPFKRVYWWTEDLSKARSKFRKAQKISKKQPLPKTHEETGELKRRYKSLIRKTRTESFKTFCTQESGTDLFQSLRKLSGTQQSFRNISYLKNRLGHLTNDDNEILSAFTETFFPVCDESLGSWPRSCQRPENETPLLTENEVREAVFSTKRTSAPGLDEITAGYPQQFFSVIKDHLFEILAAV